MKQGTQYWREVTGITKMALVGGTRKIANCTTLLEISWPQWVRKGIVLSVALVFIYEAEIDT